MVKRFLTLISVMVVVLALASCMQACSDESINGTGAQSSLDKVYEEDLSKDSYTIVLKDSTEFSKCKNCRSTKSSENLLRFLNASRAKLVFRNNESGNLVYAKYDSGDSTRREFYEIENGVPVYHPEISPDGNWVAFSDIHRGYNNISKLYVQNLNDGRLLQLDVLSAGSPHWHVLDGGDTIIAYDNDVGLNQYDNWKNSGTWYVGFEKGSFSRPTKIFDGGFVDETIDFDFAISGGSYLIVRKKVSSKNGDAYVDSIWYNNDQVCNISLARDSSRRVLFLDMGGALGRKFIGSKYQPHEYILVADSLGSLIQAVPVTEGFVYDHTKWASQGNFVVASLENAEENLIHDRIAVVNMDDESLIEIVQGEDLFHPYLWLER